MTLAAQTTELWHQPLNTFQDTQSLTSLLVKTLHLLPSPLVGILHARPWVAWWGAPNMARSPLSSQLKQALLPSAAGQVVAVPEACPDGLAASLLDGFREH